jgi:hypothetical protein
MPSIATSWLLPVLGGYLVCLVRIIGSITTRQNRAGTGSDFGSSSGTGTRSGTETGSGTERDERVHLFQLFEVWNVQSAHLLTQVCSSTNFPSVFFSSFSVLGCLIFNLLHFCNRHVVLLGLTLLQLSQVCVVQVQKVSFYWVFKWSTIFIPSYEVINKIHTITKTITL